MDYRYKQLEQDLSALTNVFSDLASRLAEASKDVTTSGVLPNEQLIEHILTARTKFESVRTAVHSQAESMLVSPLPKAGEVASIQAIGALLKTAASAEESKSSAQGELQKAADILSRVLAITHREMAAFQPLQDCHAKVVELRDAISKVSWPNRHPEFDAVVALSHPSTVLLNFVENLDTLEDDKWIALEATITEAYGKPLFVAASRGKLLAQPSATKSPEPAKPAPAAVEKPAEKKAAPEKVSEKLEKTAIGHPPVVAATPVPAAPAAVAQTPAPAPTAAPPAPAPLTPITSTTLPPRPPAPVSTPPTVAASAPPTPAPAAPVPAAASSLSALATATEPVTERKTAGTPDGAEKARKEPRLAAPPAPQQPARPEPTAQEQEQMGDEASRALAGDGSQRPQRWGFWRGNR